MAISGGVDSAVSAALLKQQGFEVVGVFMSTWHPDFLECNEEEEKRDAMRVSAYLDIPFLTFDFEDVYKKEVGNYMISEYKKGKTPNPDVMCNKHVKFGAFLDEALRRGADFIATGHYARVSPLPTLPLLRGGQGWGLLRGIDSAKDQSYFLWALTQEQLKRTLFPVGNLKKEVVRKLAEKFGLPVAEKKDSQGICFLGEVDLKKFLKHYIKEKKGKVVLAPPEAGNEKGEVIGHHDGVFFHTLGERHGFTIVKKSPKDKPYYIIGKDVKKNILIVSQSFPPDSPRWSSGEAGKGEAKGVIKLKNTNWISGTPEENKKYTAQIRYHGEQLPCKVKSNEVIFAKPILAAPGQSCVIYDHDICLGGGIVV